MFKKKNYIQYFLEKKNILIVVFSLIISEFYFFQNNSRVLISHKYVFFNTIFLFIFSIIFFYLLFKILDKDFYIKYKKVFKLLIIFLFSFIYFKIIQIPSFYGNFLNIKSLISILLRNLITENFHFLIIFLKIIIPFFFIFFLIIKIIKNKIRLICNFLITFSIFFLIILSYEIIKKEEIFNYEQLRENQTISKRKVIWFLLDELDPSYTYKKNSNNLVTYNLIDLKEKSVESENIYSAANSTLYSMSSILLGVQLSEIKIINGRVETIDVQNVKRNLNFKNTFFNKLYENKYSINIISDVIQYCSILRLEQYCSKNYNQIIHYFDGISQIYFPIAYLNKFIIKFQNREVFSIEKLNTIKTISSDKILLNKESKINLLEFKKLLNTNTDLIFFHMYLPHTHPSIANTNLLPIYVKDLFNMKVKNDDEEYLLNIKYVDLIIKEIFKEIEQIQKEEILVLLTSDHWRRVDSPKIPKPSFFVAKIINDNTNIKITQKHLNIFIPELIFQFLEKDINSHKDINFFFQNLPVFDEKNVLLISNNVED